MHGWFKIKTAANHVNMSQRTIRSWLKEGLRHSRLSSGTVLIKREWLDEYLERFEVSDNNLVEQLVDETMKEFK